MPKAVIYQKVKENKARFLRYRVDDMAEAAGHKVLRLPPYHCELNPIELIWSQVKGYVARENRTFKLAEVERLSREALAAVTPELWSNCCRHVVDTIELKMRRLDNLQDNMVERIIVNLGDSDDSSSSEDSD